MKTLIKNILLGTLLLYSQALGQLQDQTDIQVTNSSTPHFENSIAINPKDYTNIFISATGSVSNGVIQIPHYFTANWGSSWVGNDNTPNNTSGKGNSVAFFDYYGNAYLAFIASNKGSILLMKSTDGGSSWGNAVTTSSESYSTYDKPHAQADLSGTYSNHIYTVWTVFNPDGNANRYVKMGVSSDGGQTFGGTINLESSDEDYVYGPNVSVGPNGEVYVFWDMDEQYMRFSKSTNGGSSFSASNTIFNFNGIETDNTPISSLNNTYTHSFPSSGVDRSNGTYRGNVYVVYCATNNSDMNIYLQKSTDGGSTWLSQPVQVSDEPSGTNRPQWMPSIAVDPVSGTLFVSYFSMLTADYHTVRCMAVSTDGGNSFSHVTVSDQYFIPTSLSGYQNGYMGDYYETAAYGYEGYACWCDNRTGTFQTYISKIDLSTTVTVDQLLNDDATRIGKLKQWLGSAFSSPLDPPQSFSFTAGTPNILLGDQSIISNQKYYQWKTPHTSIADVTNHHNFGAIPDRNLISSFRQPNDATLQATVLDVGTPSGNASFKDPWLIDTTDQYGTRNRGMSAPFESISSASNNIGTNTNYKGVFLNQDYNIPGNPFYSISAQQVQTNMNGITGCFINWSGSGATLQQSNSLTTAVAFNSAGATVTANYKAHLGTNNTPTFQYPMSYGGYDYNLPNASPTNGNGQQRIASNWNGADYSNGGDIIVYASAGEIWTTSLDWDNLTWSPEIRLSDGQGGNSRPSIVVRGASTNDYGSNLGDGIYVVWQKQISSNPTRYNVCLATRNSLHPEPYSISDGWLTISPQDNNHQSSMIVNATACTVEPRPVVDLLCPDLNDLSDRHEFVPIVYFQDAATIKMQYAIRGPNDTYFDGNFHTTSVSTFDCQDYVPDIDMGSSLSISQPYNIHTGLDTFTVVYNYSGHSGYQLFTEDYYVDVTSGSAPQSLGDPSTVPAGDGRLYRNVYLGDGLGNWLFPYCSPQVIRRGTKTSYAWSVSQNYDDGSLPYVVYQDRTNGNWNSQYYVWQIGASSVSLGNDGTNTVLQMSIGNTMYQITDPNGTWPNSPVNIATYNDPQMTYLAGHNTSYPTISYYSEYLCSHQGSTLWSTGVPSEVALGNNGSQSIKTAKTIAPLSSSSSKSKVDPIASILAKNAESIKKGTPIHCTYERMLTLTDTSSKAQVSIIVSQPKLGKRILDFSQVPDTLNINNCMQYLCSQATTVSDADDTLSFKVSVRSRNMKTTVNPISCNLKANDATVSLASCIQDVKKKCGASTIAVPVKSYKGKSLSTVLGGFDPKSLGKNIQVSIGHIYTPDSLGQSKNDTTAKIPGITSKAVTFGSYPNPFNPTTNVTYQLPENSHVSLKVYDMLGRQIVTLADGNKEAGQYAVVFDGSHFASGVYFVRLMVQGSNSQPMVKTLKIQMLK